MPLMATKVCTKCGEALIGTGRFCASCGAAAPVPTWGATLPSQTAPARQTKTEPPVDAPPTRASTPGNTPKQAPSSYGPPPSPVNPPMTNAPMTPAPGVPSGVNPVPVSPPSPPPYPYSPAPPAPAVYAPYPAPPMPPGQPMQSAQPMPPVMQGTAVMQGYAPGPPGPPGYAPYAAPAAPYGPAFVAGARVLVQWADGNRYPGVVQQVAPNGAHCLIVFPDGQQRWVELQYLSLTR